MLILASQSPRRREILERAGISFSIRVPDVPEERRPEESPLDYVTRLSRTKAEAVERRADEVVLGADTVVVYEDHVLEKPIDQSDARRMLEILSGRVHSVITGICLRHANGVISDWAETRVRFEDLSPAEIAKYVSTGEPLDKAGAYAIQGYASKHISAIEGCYFNVVGLPVSLVYRHLKNLQPNAAGQILTEG
jgi:septum formation protein